MNQSNIETIDGIKGEWRTVTKASEVTVGQRVRMEYKGKKLGFTGLPDFPDDSCERYAVNREFLFNNGYENIQAFFPLPVKQNRKVAKVASVSVHCSGKFYFQIEDVEGKVYLYARSKCIYASRKSALRGAQRFCKAIGYEMEVVK